MTFPEIDFSRCCGYGKIDAKLDECIASGRSELVVTDLNFTPEQMKKALDHFDKVYYFDHHEGSEEHEPLTDVYGDSFVYHFSKHLSGTALMYSYWIEQGGESNKFLGELAKLTDVYDLWRTDHPMWDDAYALNDLFWRYGFWGFEERFSSGFLGFSSDDREYCNQLKERRIEILENAPKEIVNGDTLIIMLEDREAIAEVTLYYNHFNLFFIIYMGDGNYNASIRARVDSIEYKNGSVDNININKALRKILKKSERDNLKMVSGGGHKLAGGCGFSQDASIKDVLYTLKGPLYQELLPMRYFDSNIQF